MVHSTWMYSHLAVLPHGSPKLVLAAATLQLFLPRQAASVTLLALALQVLVLKAPQAPLGVPNEAKTTLLTM
jgi:hypothetical protein